MEAKITSDDYEPVTLRVQLCLEADSGSDTFFYAFVNDRRVIGADGTKRRCWAGDVPHPGKLFIKVLGTGDAEFTLTLGGIDKPLKLSEGYYEQEFDI